MLTLQDCIAFSGLTPEQIEAIADHEHLPTVLAAEWAENVLEGPEGRDLVERVLAEEVANCRAHGDLACARRYERALGEFRRCRTGRA